jgi:ADP-ribose pyrophosphatase
MSSEPAARPACPEIRLERVPDETHPGREFLHIVRTRYRAHYPDGSTSPAFDYDEVGRRAEDAVVIVAHYRAGDTRMIYLRSAVRPPVEKRVARDAGRVLDEGEVLPAHGLWELPAGLVEESEALSADPSGSGVKRAAQRELQEEVGFFAAAEAFVPLGASTYPAPGIIAERQHFFEVEVEPSKVGTPELDGSPLEHFGAVIRVELMEALEWCRSGAIMDAKTELGLRRFQELVK